ncbi:nitrate regulatory gene2 protein [Cocos nucifera]|uniref:Nitrate regulatory gene2 protein n=1 Tax=Cocos nucifera TaxID=13894 RepID=A0A8K0HVF0_COCNU|nr:nitrate regulatory gene2 protein [Cocos nucifera]
MEFFKGKKFRRTRKPKAEDDLSLESEQGALEEPKVDTMDSAPKATAADPAVEEEEDDDDDFITNEVKRRLKELRKNSFMVLIPEESCPEEEDSSSSEWRESEVEDGYPWCGFDTLYNKYCERMLFFDKMITQQLQEAGSWNISNNSPRSVSKKLSLTLRNLSFKKRDELQDDCEHLRQSQEEDPYHNLETAYVAQICLTWEALHCQYTQLSQKISSQPENATTYCFAAQAFQQFQVLLQRFIENEPFEQGSRVEIFARTRSSLSKLLQVPSFQGPFTVNWGPSSRMVLFLMTFYLHVNGCKPEEFIRRYQEMGCSASKLDDEEAVRLCRDRKNFIKEAIEQRNRFASGHTAYIQSLRRVCLALCSYVDGDEHPAGFLLDSYTTTPSAHVKRVSPEVISIPLKSFTPTPTKPGESTSFVVNCFRSGKNPSVSIEEMPESPQVVRIESYHPMDDHYGVDGSFTTDAPPVDTSFFSSPYDRPGYPPASPQTSKWDLFWNPFLLMDTYGYPPMNNLDQVMDDDEIAGLRMVQEQGIPELEEEEDKNKKNNEESMKVEMVRKLPKAVPEHAGEAAGEDDRKTRKVNDVMELQSQGTECKKVSESRNAVKLEVNSEWGAMSNRESTQETPCLTVYVDRRPTSMAEVMKDVQGQFLRICDFADEVSVMLEAGRAPKSSNSIAASSLSSSSRFFEASSTLRDDGNENGGNHLEESFAISGSHKSTLDRLYAWEKKLYEEVKTEELIRIPYEKKCMQLRSHDLNGAEPSVIDKTRAAIRDLQTRLARMWRAMAECHRIQKRTIDEAKLLLFSSSTAAVPAGPPPPRLSRSAARLEAELRNWRSCLAAWIEAQRSYARALAGWILRCAPPRRDTDDQSAQASPLAGGDGAPPLYRACVGWSRMVDAVSEVGAIDGVDFFVAGVASVTDQRREGAAAEGLGMMTAEAGTRVLCAGMSVAAGALAEFACESAEGYEALVRTWEEGGREGGLDS